MQRRGWPVPVGLALLWGLFFLFLHELVMGFGWALAALLVSLTVSAGMGVVALWDTRKIGLGGSPTQILVLGLALAVQNIGLCLALDQVGVALTAIVLSSVPLFATLTGQVWGIDRITGTGAVGLAVGFFGLLLVVAFPFHGDSWAFIAGILAALMSSLAAAFSSRYTAVRMAGRPQASASGNLLAAVFTLPLVLVFGPGHGTLGGYLTLVLVALVAASIGPMFGVRLSDGGPDRASIVKTVGTVVATVAGIVVLGEQLTGIQVVGMVVMIGGTALVLDLLPSRVRPPWRT